MLVIIIMYNIMYIESDSSVNLCIYLHYIYRYIVFLSVSEHY
jgi:hypothetical protein